MNINSFIFALFLFLLLYPRLVEVEHMDGEDSA